MGYDLDDLIRDPVVAQVTITLTRDGNMELSGTITDEKYILYMLDTARAYLAQQGERKLHEGLVIPSHDTALYRTPEERQLLAARDAVENLRAGGGGAA